MGLSFATNQYLQAPANFTLPDADWCLCCMVRVEDNTGPQLNTFLSAGTTAGSTTEFTFALWEDGRAASPRCVGLRIGDGTNLRIILPLSPQMSLSKWVFVAAQRAGSEKQVWQADFGSTPTKVAFSTASLGAVAPGTKLMIARRSNSPTVDHDLKGQMAYYARFDYALSIAQMTCLAAGLPPPVVVQPTEYLPLPISGPASMRAVIGGAAYAVTGSPATYHTPVRLW